MTHICVSKPTTIGSDNGLSPAWRQAIIWTNDRILFIVPLETKFGGFLIRIYKFFSMKRIWKRRMRNGGHLSRPRCVKHMLLLCNIRTIIFYHCYAQTEREYRHFDEITVISYTGCSRNNNSLCNHWPQFRQNGICHPIETIWTIWLNCDPFIIWKIMFSFIPCGLICP